MSLPRSFTAVTPFSKALALTLFILLPFIGFYLGIRYQEAITPAPPLMVKQPLPSPTMPILEITKTPDAPCPINANDYTSIRSSDNAGWCELTLPLKDYSVTGYTILYPKDWDFRLAGAEGMNLLFNENKKTGVAQELFIQITTTTLPLEQTDNVTYAYETSEQSPLIDPTERIISKTRETIGDKAVWHVVTNNNGTTMQRFFLLHPEKNFSSVYMFRYSGTDTTFVSDIHTMIASMKFAK